MENRHKLGIQTKVLEQRIVMVLENLLVVMNSLKPSLLTAIKKYSVNFSTLVQNSWRINLFKFISCGYILHMLAKHIFDQPQWTWLSSCKIIQYTNRISNDMSALGSA